MFYDFLFYLFLTSLVYFFVKCSYVLGYYIAYCRYRQGDIEDKTEEFFKIAYLDHLDKEK
jgi:hypothetical protein